VLNPKSWTWFIGEIVDLLRHVCHDGDCSREEGSEMARRYSPRLMFQVVLEVLTGKRTEGQVVNGMIKLPKKVK